MGAVLRVLVVEDSPDDAELLALELARGGYQPAITRVQTAESLRQALSADAWDLVVSDYSMPDLTGLDALQIVKDRGLDVPFILMSGAIDEELAVEAMVRGAHDYVMKDRRARLLPAIERELAEARVRQSQRETEAMHRAVVESALDPIVVYELDDGDRPGRVLTANRAASEMLGYGPDELPGLPLVALFAAPGDAAVRHARLLRAGRRRFRAAVTTKGGTLLHMAVGVQPVVAGGRRVAVAIGRDITERLESEDERQAVIEVLRLANEHHELKALVRAVTGFLQRWSGCDAVGVRLVEGEDFPYYETRGFAPEFVAAETHLCQEDASGQIVRDGQGRAVLECMCGNVLRGRCDPRQPFFTSRGSFWSNHTTDLLATTSDTERQARTCNRCTADGFESVALLPLRAHGKTLGLLQLNDHRAGRFSERRIAALERLCDSLAVAIDQSRTAAELARSEERFRTIADYTADWENWVGPNGELLWTSPSVERMTGYTVAECLAMPDYPTPLVAPEDRSRMAALFHQAVGGDGGRDTEFRCRRKDGSVFWAAVSYHAVHDATGACQGYRSSIRDISERKRHEQLMQARLRLADLAISSGLDEFMRVAVDEAERLTGSQVGFFHFVDADQVHLRLQAWSTNTVAHLCTASGKGDHYPISEAGVWVDCVHARVPVIHNDYASLPHRRGLPEGHAPVVRELVVPVLRDGLVVGILGVGNKPTDYGPDDVAMVEVLSSLVIDLIARKRAEESLQESEAKYRAIVENMQDVYYRTDVDGRLVMASPSACDLLGCASLDEVLGLSPEDLWATPERRAEYLAAMEHHDGRVTGFEVTFRRRDGSEVATVVSSRWRYATDGQWLGTEGVITDISDRKRAEAAIRVELALQRLRNLVLQMAGEDDWPMVVHGFAAEVRRLIEFESCSVNLLDAGESRVTSYVVGRGGEVGREVVTGVHPALARAAHTGRPVRRERGDALFGSGQSAQVAVIVDVPFPGGTVALSGTVPDGLGPAEIHILEQSAEVLAVACRRLADLEAVRASDERVATVFRSSPNAITVTRVSDGRLVDFNDGFVTLSGYAREEALGRTTPELRLWADEATRNAVLVQLRAGLGVRNTEVQFRVKSGEVIDCLVSSEVVSLGGEPHALTTVTDVTDRKRATEELRRAEERFRLVVELAPIGIFLQVDGRFAFVNPAMAHLLGCADPTALLGQPVLGRVAPGSVESMAARLRQVSTGPEAAPVAEAQFCRLDGTVVDVSVGAAPFEVEGQPGALVMVADMSAAKRSEARLRASEALYQSLVESLPQAVFRKDLDGRYVFANRRLGEVLGRAAADIVGHTDEELLPREVAGAFGATDEEVKATGRPTHTVSKVAIPGQPERMMEANKVPLFDSNGQLAGVLGIATDVTERTLLEEQVRHAQRMESIGRLAGGVAHDFNNLLVPIQGYAQLLADTIRADDPRHTDLEQIQQAAARAKDLTRQLLAFSRKQVLELSPVDLRQVVNGFQKLIRRTVREDIRLDVVLPEASATVMADIGQIEQVLMNLAVNAQDAMPAGGVLTIEVVHRPADVGSVGTVELSVSDTGVGMDAETLAKVFEPFYTTKAPGKGTGLGLATVHGIIDQHGGTVSAESAPGQGATLRIRLPAALQATALAADQAGEPRPAARQATGETVVFVDDDEGIRELAQRVLRARGYELLVASSGESCLATLARHTGPVDLLVTDVVMPGMTGKELHERLAMVRPGVRVLFVSGHDDDVISTRGVVEAGFWFLAKPFTPQDLADKVRQVLDAAG